MSDVEYRFAVYESGDPNRLPHLIVVVPLGGLVSEIQVLDADGDLARAERKCAAHAADFLARKAADSAGK